RVDPARAATGAEGARRERRRPDAVAARYRASARSQRPRVRLALHGRQADRVRLSRLSVAHPPPDVQADEPRQPARARLQGGRDDDDAVRHGHAERPRPVPPRDRRDRPPAATRLKCRAPATGAAGLTASCARLRTRARGGRAGDRRLALAAGVGGRPGVDQPVCVATYAATRSASRPVRRSAGIVPGPCSIASRTACCDGRSESRFVPIVPGVPAAASLWHAPHWSTKSCRALEPAVAAGSDCLPPPPQPAAAAASATTRSAALARTLEDDEHGELLVRRELVVGAGLDEHRVPRVHLDRRALHVERAAAVEDDVHLVVGVRLLTVGLRRDEDVHAEFDAGRLVHDLVAAAGGAELLDDARYPESVHGADATTRTSRAAAAPARRRARARRRRPLDRAAPARG